MKEWISFFILSFRHQFSFHIFFLDSFSFRPHFCFEYTILIVSLQFLRSKCDFHISYLFPLEQLRLIYNISPWSDQHFVLLDLQSLHAKSLIIEVRLHFMVFYDLEMLCNQLSISFSLGSRKSTLRSLWGNTYSNVYTWVSNYVYLLQCWWWPQKLSVQANQRLNSLFH